MRFAKSLLLLASLALLGRAAEPTFEERQTIEKVATFLDRYGKPKDGEWLRGAFKTGRVSFTSGPDAGIDEKDRIFLNATMVDMVRLRDPHQQFRAVADLAATVLHERTHLGQSHFSQGISRIQNMAGGDHPSEVEAWRTGFQSYRDWIRKQQERVREAQGEAAREEESQLLRGLMQSFEMYRREYEAPGNHFGAMTFEDGLTLAQASAEVQKALVAVNQTLRHADFQATVHPVRVVAKRGDVFSLTASASGGAFNEGKKAGNLATYTFQWSAGGQRLPETGPTLRRTAGGAEVISVVALDRLGAKSSEAVCRVEVAEPPKVLPPTPMKPPPSVQASAPPPKPKGCEPKSLHPASGKATGFGGLAIDYAINGIAVSEYRDWRRQLSGYPTGSSVSVSFTFYGPHSIAGSWCTDVSVMVDGKVVEKVRAPDRDGKPGWSAAKTVTLPLTDAMRRNGFRISAGVGYARSSNAEDVLVEVVGLGCGSPR
jgi:hypothetical protein